MPRTLAFRGWHGSLQNINNMISDFRIFNGAGLVSDLISVFIHLAEDDLGQKVVNRQEFYDHIYGLDYIGVNFKLKMGGRDLDELSPGERGIVLLIFYLRLGRKCCPQNCQ